MLKATTSTTQQGIDQFVYDARFVNQHVKAREEAIVSQWKERDIYRKGIRREGGKPFITYDGPPFATGNPHYGHILAMTIKDAICSHKALSGHDVQTRFGWDCHGVPIEVQAQKKLKLTGHNDIVRLGINKFNSECKDLIFTCVEEWDKQTKRLGRFIDMGQGHDYKTMDASYMSSVWGVFGRLHKKGLVYKGYKVVPYSPSLGTGLSDFEAGLNYQKLISPAVTMAFPLKEDVNTQFLVWTTTPWSVPANVAIAINPLHQYVKVSMQNGTQYILLKSLHEQYFNDPHHPPVSVQDIAITDYIGQEYVPMFDCLPASVDDETRNKCYRIRESAHVTDTDGTGCVHICPAYGVDDYQVGQKHGLPVIDFIDTNGFFNEVSLRIDSKPLGVKGRYFKKVYGEGASTATADASLQEEVADILLMRLMKAQARLFKSATVHHEYPLCWRTNTPLMYRAIESWFINVTAIKPQLIENNATVKWHPENIGTHRFANWLNSAHDWAISRTRYWGCPMPIWVNTEDPNDIIVVKSQSELEALTAGPLKDLHRENIDDIELHVNGHCYKRIKEVFDCWFESGSMPYAQHGLQFTENEEAFLAHHFPADFIAEGLDQTRGWFYALSVIGTALFGQIPFKNVIVNGILLGNDGKKMSKSVGNFPPIDSTFEKYGADAIRLFLLASPAVQAESLSVKDESIKVCYQNTIIPILNVFKFFADAANYQGIYLSEPVDIQRVIAGEGFGLLNPFDAWLVYRTELFKHKVAGYFEAYDLVKATNQIDEYVSDLTHWYVRMSRSRANLDNLIVFTLLHYALDTFCRYAAPVLPFTTESIFCGLYRDRPSVHLECHTPIVDASPLQSHYETVEKVRQIYAMSLALREKHGLRLRQPVQTVYLDERLAQLLAPYEQIIKELINCKEVQWTRAVGNALFETSFVLAPGLARQRKKEFPRILECFKKGEYTIEDHGNKMLLASGQVLIAANGDFFHAIKSKTPNYACDLKRDIWVALDVGMNAQLLQEGLARDFLREIVRVRKRASYAITDTIELVLEEKDKELIDSFGLDVHSKKCAFRFVSALDEASSSEDLLIQEIGMGERATVKIRLAFRNLGAHLQAAHGGAYPFDEEDGDVIETVTQPSTVSMPLAKRFFEPVQQHSATQVVQQSCTL